MVGPPSAEGGVVVKIDQAGHDRPTVRIDRLRAFGDASADVGRGADRDDAIAVDRDRAVEEDVVVVVHRDDDRVVDQQHRARSRYAVGTTMRSSTCWNATFASCRTLPWSIVVNSWSRYTTWPSMIVVLTALPLAANTRCEYRCAFDSGNSGVNIWLSRSIRITSAFLPAVTSPVSCRSAAEPFRVAMRTTSGACCRLGSTRLARCINDANFITSNRSRLLLHSAASWPSPTLIPAASISGTRAIPLPSFALDDGLCEICVPVSRISAISLSESQTQCAAMHLS